MEVLKKDLIQYCTSRQSSKVWKMHFTRTWNVKWIKMHYQKMLQVYTQFKHLFLNHSPTVPQNYFCHVLHTFTYWSFGYVVFSEFYNHELQNKIIEHQLNDNRKAITFSLFYTLHNSKEYSHHSQRNPLNNPFAMPAYAPHGNQSLRLPAGARDTNSCN